MKLIHINKNFEVEFSMSFKASFIRRLSKFISVITPKNKKLIVFESFLGRQYSDNPRAIYEYLKREKEDYICYWSVDPKHINKFKDENLKTIKRFTLKWLFVAMRAKYWISNSRIPLWIYKPNGTTYIQTWHGTPLKKLAMDLDNTSLVWKNLHLYKQRFISESARWDYLISPNDYSTKIFRHAFDFKNEIIESGYPRNDYLINNNTPENITRIKSKIGIPKNKKVILYAPTWRDSFSFDLPLSITNLKKSLGDDYFIIVRLHYLVTKTSELIGHDDFIKNVSSYNDINELYLISDILVTDYSSVFFDYAVLQRPIIFYCYDLDEYKNDMRGFYFDFEKEAPGPIVQTSDELIDAVHNIVNYKLPSKFVKTFSSLEDGNASKRVVEQIIKS